ncbi:MAG: D-aminoacyl-tRNA deacylase [Candidatus Krumholzibacteriia bacterium]
MRAVIQRVEHASVTVDHKEVARIGGGIAVLVGFAAGDNDDVLRWMARKIVSLRLFEDEGGKMNLDLAATGGGVLLVSQFTLYGDCKKGKRPSFEGSAPVDVAADLYGRFQDMVREEAPGEVASGVFRARMQVSLVNDGPVTLIVDKEPA